MPATKVQLHIRLDPEPAEAATKRATEMGVSLNEWLTRAVVHAIEHAKTNGEPQPLRLPWSVLL
jgi:hypothetical protein